MAVIGSRDFKIGCATNIVHGDQHNQTINIRFGARRVGKQRQARRKADELELIDQYRKIPLGDIYKVKQIGSSEVWEAERDEDGRLVSTCIGKRTYYHSKLYGDDKVYTAVTYSSGKDVSKLWKEDFVKYSGSHGLSDDSAMAWQLLGINRSKIPALIFYNEWLPMAHFCPSPDKLWMVLYATLLSKYLRCDSWNLWFNSQSGQFSCGPQGPDYWSVAWPTDLDIVDDLCFTADMLQVDICVRFLSKSSLNLDNYFLCLATYHQGNICLNHFFGIEHHCTHACFSGRDIIYWDKNDEGLWQRRELDSYNIHDKVLDFLGNSRFDAIHSGGQRREIARMAEGFVLRSSSYNDSLPLHDRKLVQGMTRRYSLDTNLEWRGTSAELQIVPSGGYSFDPRHTWLSQAHYHFGCDVDGIESCYYLDFYTSIGIDHSRRPNSSLGSKNGQHATDGRDDTGPKIYLFIRPLARLSEVENWMNGKPFFWSFDEDGTTRIPESMREQLGLPTLTLPKFACVFFRSFSKHTYDTVHKWQVAKGFEPSAPDFARSFGFPIFDRVRPEQSRSDEIVNEERKLAPKESPNTSDSGESSLLRLTKSFWWQATQEQFRLVPLGSTFHPLYLIYGTHTISLPLQFMAALAAAAIQLNIEITNNATVSSILVLSFSRLIHSFIANVV